MTMNQDRLEGLDNLRHKMGKLVVPLMWIHVPVVGLAGLMSGGGTAIAGIILTVLLSLAVTASLFTGASGLTHRAVSSVALVSLASVLVFVLRGHPWQIDMHMYFFCCLAIVSVFCCTRSLLLGAGAIAVHHLVLNFIVPAWVFPDGGGLASRCHPCSDCRCRECSTGIYDSPADRHVWPGVPRT